MYNVLYLAMSKLRDVAAEGLHEFAHDSTPMLLTILYQYTCRKKKFIQKKNNGISDLAEILLLLSFGYPAVYTHHLRAIFRQR